MRFVLASIVIFAHFPFVMGHAPSIWTPLTNGAGAVWGFFIISGYSIAASIERDGDVKRFYERRFWRIVPTYVAGFLFSLVPWAIYGGMLNVNGGIWHRPPVIDFVMNGICLQTLVTPPTITYAQSWSLFPECYYYFLTPLFVVLKPKAMALVVAVSIVVFVLHYKVSTIPLSNVHGLTTPIGLMWAWLSGFIYFRYRESKAAILMLFLPQIFLVHLDPSNDPLNGPVVSVAVAAVIMLTGSVRVGKISGVLTWLGDVSYPLYLTHMTVMLLLCMRFGKYLNATSPAPYYLVPTVVAVAFYYLFDKPFRKGFRQARFGGSRKFAS